MNAPGRRISFRGSLLGLGLPFVFLVLPFASIASGGLVAHWSFDDDFAVTIGGSQYDLTAIGDGSDPLIDEGFSRFGGGSARFTRDNEQYLEGLTPFGSGSYTFSAWYWLDLEDIPVGTNGASGTNRYEVLSATTNAESTFPASYSLRDIGDGDIGQVFGHFASPASSPSFSFNPGAHQKWTNVIVTYDSTVGLLATYLNGVAVGSLSVEGTLQDSDVIRIGNGRNSVRWWEGWIDEVGVWNRVLTISEISRLQESTIGELFIDDFEETPLAPGDTFKECPDCPSMVVIVAGTFVQGSPESEPGSSGSERPQREVNIPAFSMGQTSVTFSQWDACVADGGCTHDPDDNGWGYGDRPVISVNWHDAQEYVAWLSEKTGHDYRLPSESESEYAIRAGTTGRFNTGDCITSDQANFNASDPARDCPTGTYQGETLPVASFAPNYFGLYDTHGNVQEWAQDCWNAKYFDAPTDGSAWMSGDCERAVIRTSAMDYPGDIVRSAFRHSSFRDSRYFLRGFRVARSVTP